MTARDTIVAIATANGTAGIGVLRLSGPQAITIASVLCGMRYAGDGASTADACVDGRLKRELRPRQAHYARFREASGELLDDGLVIVFPAPRSFTGEDVVELHGHGNPRLLARLVARCVALGARPARPGEFSERAFLEGRLDLVQAEAVADLIAAGSENALRAARRSMDGVFSARVGELVEALTALRVNVEAAIDFPDEEIDFLDAPEISARLELVETLHTALRRDAARGARMMDGLHVVIVGAPNAGKSALLNALSGAERAIVTPIPGTTRDVLREMVCLDGIELTLVDTAGLRETTDIIEAEGIRRARAEVQRADGVLAVLDDREAATAIARLRAELRFDEPAVLWLHTHADLTNRVGEVRDDEDGRHFWIDTRCSASLDSLREALHELAGGSEDGQGAFSARARHVEAIDEAGQLLAAAAKQLSHRQGELAAEDLRLAQDALGAITGRVGADALLGRIFSSFCIGK